MPLRCVRMLWVVGLACALSAYAADQPQWGERFTRNMVSAEKSLPTDFDPKAGKGVLWSAALGSNGYGSPIVANGKVFIGANNTIPRDPRHQGDRGVMLCLNEKDGTLCWQLVVPRLDVSDKFLDWPEISLCSPPTVEGDRVYLVTNRCEVVCLDLNGMANGNDGPYKDEGRHMAPADQPAMETNSLDADIVWLFDMRTGADIYPHDSPQVSILVDGDYLYLNTPNGVDNTHLKVRKPDGPALIALDKKTGRLLAKDAEGIGKRLFHATWSSPAFGDVNGKREIFFGGPDGVVYTFAALSGKIPENVQTFNRIWRFDCDPASPKEDLSKYSTNLKEGPSTILGMPVFYKNRIYVTVGGDIWWGKRLCWLKCIDATKTGDITTGGEIWSYPLERYSCATPAIANGLVFATDCSGKIHCVDAETGKPCWTHDIGKEMWGSCLAADGKIYVGARNGAFAILAAEKEKKVINTIQFDDPICSTPTAANGILYVNTLTKLYALK